MNGPGDFTSVRVWHINRTHCTRCGEVKEFQSESAARQYAADHERVHNNPAIYRTPENVDGL